MSLPPVVSDPGEHWDKLLAQAQAIVNRIQPYRNAEGGITSVVPRRDDVFWLAEALHHAVRYARDAESGNEALRNEVCRFCGGRKPDG